MYSPVLFPSSRRAAPAKKRRLSEQTGISSRAYPSGLPTLRDSIRASSSAFASSRSASLSRISARSPGVESSHSGSARLAVSTAASTSSAVPAGTCSITSAVDGLRMSMVALIRSSVFGTKDPTLSRQPLGEGDGNDRHRQDKEDDDVHLGQLLPEADLAEDPDRERVLGPGGERRHDHLVEGEREGEEAAGDERGRDRRKGDEAEGQ